VLTLFCVCMGERVKVPVEAALVLTLFCVCRKERVNGPVDDALF
jgi:hypothetical protein